MSRKILALIVVALVTTLSEGPRAAQEISRPAVPADLEVSAAYKLFFAGHAVGTQNFICAPAATASGVDWLFIGPQATLFDGEVQQNATHFQSKNPSQADAIQATWQHSRDSSAVWAKKFTGSTDAAYVAPGAIEWLLLEVTGHQTGPDGGDRLARTAYIQRVNTVGGMKPPSSECTASTLNTRRLVSYEADYYFYR
jgi:hypothetical protein